MPAPVRTLGTASSTGLSTTSFIPVPASVAAGDIVLADIYVESTTTPTPPDGTWTLKIQVNQASYRQYQFWKRATGADAGNYNFTLGGTFWQAGIASRVTGCVASGDPYDGTPSTATATSATTGSTSLTTTGPDRLLLHTATNFTGGTWTQPAGWSEDFEGALELSSLSQAVAGGTGSITATCSASAENAAILSALIPAGLLPSLEQTRYRFGADDGNEAAHTFTAAENTGVTLAAGVPQLVRIQVDETASVAISPRLAIQYKRSDEAATEWRNLTT